MSLEPALPAAVPSDENYLDAIRDYHQRVLDLATLHAASVKAPHALVVGGQPTVVVNPAEGHVDLVYAIDGTTVRLEDQVVRLLVATILATDPT